MSSCKAFLDSSLSARVGETVTLRDVDDNQVAIFTFIKTRTGGRRSANDVARVARKCAAAQELYDALSSIENDDGSIPKAIWDMRNAALAKARGE